MRKIVLLNMEDQKQQHQINIELTDEVAEGIYSNLAVIAHSHSEFVIDFVRLVPNVPKAKVKSRILITPTHAKRLLQALAENVQKYEGQFGKIDEPDNNQMPPMTFSPMGQA